MTQCKLAEMNCNSSPLACFCYWVTVFIFRPFCKDTLQWDCLLPVHGYTHTCTPAHHTTAVSCFDRTCLCVYYVFSHVRCFQKKTSRQNVWWKWRETRLSCTRPSATWAKETPGERQPSFHCPTIRLMPNPNCPDLELDDWISSSEVDFYIDGTKLNFKHQPV